jgi:hypothetical protein
VGDEAVVRNLINFRLGDVAHADLATQVSALTDVLYRSATVARMVERLPALALPEPYLGAGVIAQTVWNAAHGFHPLHGIKDADIVYFDSDDASGAAESRVQQQAVEAFADLSIPIDVKNQARVHEWYEQKFGVPSPPLRSSEHAISTWPTTATSIGVRLHHDRTLTVCAPYGLRDLFALVVRPNKTLAPESVFAEKATRWKREWPCLLVVS